MWICPIIFIFWSSLNWQNWVGKWIIGYSGLNLIKSKRSYYLIINTIFDSLLCWKLIKKCGKKEKWHWLVRSTEPKRELSNNTCHWIDSFLYMLIGRVWFVYISGIGRSRNLVVKLDCSFSALVQLIRNDGINQYRTD